MLRLKTAWTMWGMWIVFGEIFPEVEQQEDIVVTAYYPETVDVATVEADLQARLAELTDFMDLGESRWHDCLG